MSPPIELSAVGERARGDYAVTTSTMLFMSVFERMDVCEMPTRACVTTTGEEVQAMPFIVRVVLNGQAAGWLGRHRVVAINR